MTFNYKQWYQQNRIRLNKVKQDKYYKLKQQVYQPYSFHCEVPGCNECNIRELMMIPGCDTPEAKALKKVKSGDKRLRYLKKVGYSKEFGIVVVCKKCNEAMRNKTSIEKLMKAQIKRDERAKVIAKIRLKKEEKAKKKLENWLKDRIHSLENEIAVSQVKLDGYTGRLDKLNLTDQMIEKPEPVKVKKGLRNWLKRIGF